MKASVFFAVLLALAGALAWPADARADDALAVVQQRLAAVEVLRGQFTQERQVAGFQNPLRSQGDFLLARGKGVIWRTRAPIASEQLVTENGVVMRPQATATGATGGAGQRMFGQMLLALMAGDLQGLSERFDIQAQELPAERWQLQLRPRSSRLGRMLKQIDLEGGRYVSVVTVQDVAGDTTTITFSQLQPLPAKLTADEAARFD